MEKVIGIILIVAVMLVGTALVFLFVRWKYARIVSTGLLMTAVAGVSGGVIYCKDALDKVWSGNQFIMLAVLAAVSVVIGIATIVIDMRKPENRNKKCQETEGVDE